MPGFETGRIEVAITVVFLWVNLVWVAAMKLECDTARKLYWHIEVRI